MVNALGLVAWVLLALATGFGPVSAKEPVEIELSIEIAPTDQWSKGRLEAALESDGALVLRDSGRGDFNDASFWEIPFNRSLPFGRKELSVRIDVDPRHTTLWGPKLLQPIIDGIEAEPATDDDGRPFFEKSLGGDGKGFLPPQSSIYRFDLPKEAERLGSFAFMTAGARGFNITLSEFKITVWPEADDRLRAQRPLMSELSYGSEETKRLMIEWHGGELGPSSDTETIIVSGPTGEREVTVAVPRVASVASASRVSRVDLDGFDEPGNYRVIVPATGAGTEPGSIEFRVADNRRELEGHRDDAWSVFYWITDNEHGPYPDAHAQDAVAKTYGDERVVRDVSGGWFDAGDYGKYTVNGAYSVGLMLLTGLLAPEALEHSIDPLAGGRNGWPDWLGVTEAQLDWLVKMQAPDGGANHKATTRDWPGLDVSPMGDTAVKWIMPVSSTATADYAAVMALAAKVLEDQPGEVAVEKAARFRAAAERARHWLAANQLLLKAEESYEGKDYGGPYWDIDDSDERFFADAAWAALTRDPSAIAAVESRLGDRRRALERSGFGIYWGGVNLLGFWALKTIEADLSPGARQAVDTVLDDAARRWADKQKRSPWSVPHGDGEMLPWGSNSVLATRGWHWLLWANVSGDDRFVAPARDLRHWFFGRNPLGQTFVTGRSERAAKDPHFRPSVSGAIPLPDGMLVGGPNSGGHSGDSAAMQLAGEPPMRMYVDDRWSYSTNEVAINWQSVWALYLSLLAAQER